jgi:hypothetical protein
MNINQILYNFHNIVYFSNGHIAIPGWLFISIIVAFGFRK